MRFCIWNYGIITDTLQLSMINEVIFIRIFKTFFFICAHINTETRVFNL